MAPSCANNYGVHWRKVLREGHWETEMLNNTGERNSKRKCVRQKKMGRKKIE